MNIIASTGKEEVAIVYIAEFGEGKRIELVESLQPPIPAKRSGCCWSPPCSAARWSASCAMRVVPITVS